MPVRYTPMRKKIVNLLEAVQEFIDTNPNESSNLAESEVLIDTLVELLAKEEKQTTLAA